MESTREEVIERWEILTHEPEHIDHWLQHGSAQGVRQTLAIWREDHPDWNPNADLDADAQVLWDWIEETLRPMNTGPAQ